MFPMLSDGPLAQILSLNYFLWSNKMTEETLTQPSITFEKEVKETGKSNIVLTVPSATTENQTASLSQKEEKKLFWETLDEKTALKLKFFCKSAKSDEKKMLENLINSTFTRLKVDKIEDPDADKDLSSQAKEKLERIARVQKISIQEVVKNIMDQNIPDKSLEILVKQALKKEQEELEKQQKKV